MTGSAAQFATTHWSIVLSTHDLDTSRAEQCLAKLCQTYWYPLYAFIRRQGYSAHDAQDLTQEFFARLLEKNYLAEVQREKGRFRSFLLAALKHFLANEWDKRNAQKRGGGKVFIPLDADSAETRYGLEPSHNSTPDKIFERQWALTLLEKVLAQLRAEFVSSGKEIFDHLKSSLAGTRDSILYAELAEKLRTTEGAVKVAVHRLRQRYRELLRDELDQTVETTTEIDAELADLIAALS